MSNLRYNQQNYEFKQPKSLDFKSPLTHNGSLLSPRRPQPSPSKSQRLMKDLGLDLSDTNLSDSSSLSSDDDDFEAKGGVGASQAEFNALKHELDLRTRERENLLIRNKDYEAKLSDYKRRLHREQLKGKSHMKILATTHQDLVKDKESLIENLQDIICENELKIEQLDSGIKGTPIQNSESKPSSITKLVESIKNLHTEKSKLHTKVLQLEQTVEEKEADLIHLQENCDLKNGNGMSKSKTDSEKVVVKLQEEVILLKNKIAGNNEQFDKDHEKIREENESLMEKFEAIQDEKRSIEKKYLSQISKLEKEVEKKKTKISKLKCREPEVVTNIVEKVVEVESEALKNDLQDARSKMSNLERTNKEADRSISRLKDENERLKSEIQRMKLDLSSSMHDVEEVQSNMEEEKSGLLSRIADLEMDIAREKRNVEKSKAHANKEKSKVGKLELEVQELKASVHHVREEAAQERESMEQESQERENEVQKEREEMRQAQLREQKENEKNVERLEKKIFKTSEKLRSAKESCDELEQKLKEKTYKINDLHEEVASLEDSNSSLKNALHESEHRVTTEHQNSTDLSKQLSAAQEEAKLFKHQLNVLSGASDVATVALSEKDKENKSLREQIASLNEEVREVNRKLANSEIENSSTNKELEDLHNKIASMKNHHENELEKLNNEHFIMLNSAQKLAEESYNSISSKAMKLQTSLRHLVPIVRSLTQDNNLLRKDCAKFPILIQEASIVAAKQINEAISDLNDNNAEMVRRYVKEMKLRKKYHNELVELKGNIRVFVRVRPKISEDGSGVMAKSSVTFDQNDDGMIYVHNSQRGRSQIFELDKVFTPESTQQEVYSEVQSLVTSCIDGYHVCIFAYGQTGSGKTYTMEGPTKDPGINQRALKDLFFEVDDRSKDWSYEISVSLVEIYNETLRDLLNKQQEKLEIKMNSDGSLFVTKLKRIPVENLDDVNQLFKLGKSNRATASTDMNEHSSRSHAVLIIYVQGVNQTNGAKTFGKLNLIDLAGSERVSKSGASGDRLEEAKNINRSLSAIGDVIHALRSKSSHVPFRNSKLTYMLQDSLSKDSKTLMVVQVAPVEKNVSETICSLSFAQRVRSVELGQASKKTEESRNEELSTPQKRSGIPTGRTNTPTKRK